MNAIAEIKKDSHGFFRLYAEGNPFLILGGELHNSASSDITLKNQKHFKKKKK